MSVPDAIHFALSLTKTIEEAEAWLHTRQRSLDGCRPVDLIRVGKADQVLTVAERLAFRKRKQPSPPTF